MENRTRTLVANTHATARNHTTRRAHATSPADDWRIALSHNTFCLLVTHTVHAIMWRTRLVGSNRPRIHSTPFAKTRSFKVSFRVVFTRVTFFPFRSKKKERERTTETRGAHSQMRGRADAACQQTSLTLRTFTHTPLTPGLQQTLSKTVQERKERDAHRNMTAQSTLPIDVDGESTDQKRCANFAADQFFEHHTKFIFRSFVPPSLRPRHGLRDRSVARTKQQCASVNLAERRANGQRSRRKRVEHATKKWSQKGDDCEHNDKSTETT